MNREARTLSTKIEATDYEEFVKRAKQLGMTPSALLRRLVREFLEKPVEEYDKVSRLEKEIEKIKAEIAEMRARIDMLTRRVAYLERRRGYIRRELGGEA